jgi:hypothetical protein
VTIDEFTTILRKMAIQGVDAYEKKLRDNEADSQRIEDLACEGYVALAFAKYGWAVTIREQSPDLEVRLNGLYLGVEVKHFRWKSSHDPVEDAALAAADEEFRPAPILLETEGREQSWDQMFRFAKDNARQYMDGEYNVMFFWSDTQAHCDITLLTAANMYDEELEKPSCEPRMRNLSAMMMNAVWGRGGSIFLQRLPHAQKPLTPELYAMLDEIRQPYDRFQDAR